MGTYYLKYFSVFQKEILWHIFIGAVTGYLIIHPLTMVIYWIEFNNDSLSVQLIKEVVLSRFLHSFSSHMLPMSLLFIIIGSFIGLGSGIYSGIIRKNKVSIKSNESFLIKSVRKLIEEGESQTVGFESSLRYDYRQVKTDKSLESIVLIKIAGFLNSKGGMLLLGVDHFGTILGLANDYWTLKRKDKEGFQQRIVFIVSNSLGTDICSLLHITFHTIHEKEICCLNIDPSQRPVYVKEGQRTVFYLRTGNVTKPLNTKETVEYLRTKK